MWFSQDEMLALMTIQSMIVQLEPGLLGPKLKPFQKRLDDMLASQGLDAAALTQRVRAVHAGKRRLPLTSFETLTKATLERQQVPVEHLNRQKGETVLRDISPSNWCTTGTTGMWTPVVPPAWWPAQLFCRCHHKRPGVGQTQQKHRPDRHARATGWRLRHLWRHAQSLGTAAVFQSPARLCGKRNLAPGTKKPALERWPLRTRHPLRRRA